MTKIAETCACGAQFSIDDTFHAANYVWEAAKKWRDEHPCPVKEQATPVEGHLRRQLMAIEELAKRGKIHSEGVRVGEEWPVHETIHFFSVIREKAKDRWVTADPPSETRGAP